MSIVEDLRALGFGRGLTYLHNGQRFDITHEEAAQVPPPLVYVIVDRNGESVKTGRSLAQNIIQRRGSEAAVKGLNGMSTDGQNNKPVTVKLRREILLSGPLVVYVRHCQTRDEAKEEEKALYDRFPGRIDVRRG